MGREGPDLVRKPPSLYDIQHREVDPVYELLKAVLDVNWWANRASILGWNITLSAEDEGSVVGIMVDRADCWPNKEAEDDAAAEAPE